MRLDTSLDRDGREPGPIDRLDPRIKLVVAAENVFLWAVGQKIFHLPFVGKASTAGAVDIRTQDDHRLAVYHDNVANANFFCRFHSEYT